MADNSANIIFGLVVFVPFVIAALLYDMDARKGAEDPANAKYATPFNIAEKLVSHIDTTALYTVWVVRQSGNYDRGYENVSGSQIADLITPTLKRAKIDAVAIKQRRKYLSVYRTMRNHRGRNEGKKVGGFHIIKQS